MGFLTRTPQDRQALLLQGLALHQRGRPEEAAERYRAILQADPEDFNALHLAGVACLDLGAPDQAERLIRQAIDRFPDGPAFHNNLGNALLSQARAEEAIACYGRALALQPVFEDAAINLARAHSQMGRFDAAAATLLEAAERQPESVQTLLHLASVLVRLGLTSEGLAALGRGLSLDPGRKDAWNTLGVCLQATGDLAGARTAFLRALDLDPDFHEARSNFLGGLNYEDGIDRATLWREHLAYEQAHARKRRRPAAPWPHDRNPEKRLRIGYVSADFREHSVAYFLEPLLAAHDRAQVETFAYSSVLWPDSTTARLQGLVDHWRSVNRLPDAEVADRIRADGIDILVDLSGHTSGHRLLVFAEKPAPVQLSWLGYPNTTGLSAIDARVADAAVEPEGAEAFSSESILRLPLGFHCYRPPQNAPPVAGLPAAEQGFVTFGSFNNFSKLRPPALEAWARLLRRVPGSRLLLKDRVFRDEAARNKLATAFEGFGIAAARLDLLPRLPGTANHLSAYGRVDIGLDTFPYNGTTTTCEALWMGVPVVTVLGDRHAARVGASLLAQAGLEDLVATDLEGYVDAAARLASDLPGLARLRAGLRERMAASPLRDEAGFARRMEQAYRNLWRAWCRENPSSLGTNSSHS